MSLPELPPLLKRTRFCRGAQPIEDRAFGGAEGFVALVADEPLLLPRMDTDIALASLASGRARQIGAEYRGGVHDRPPGVAGEHSQEEYGWPPIFFPSAPQHGLVLVMTQNSVTL